MNKLYITTAVDPPFIATKFCEQGKDIPLQRVKIVDERYNIPISSPTLHHFLAKPFVPILPIDTSSSMIAWALHIWYLVVFRANLYALVDIVLVGKQSERKKNKNRKREKE